MDQKKKELEMASLLLSPPDTIPLESFSRTTASLSMESKSNDAKLFPSPPTSPEEKAQSVAEDLTGVAIRDIILFDNQSGPSSQSPLFAGANESQRRVVQDHIAARQVDPFCVASPPLPKDYQLALEFKSQVAQRYDMNRKLWRSRERAQLAEDNALKMGRRYTPIAPAHASGRSIKPAPRTMAGKSSGSKVEKAHRRPHVPKTVRAGTPDRRVAREDKDFSALDDFCPPISSLPNRPNSLKVDWRGAPIDLRTDSHVHLLHPDEVALAGNLRLDCATYLTSKRRIFIKRVECIRIGKEFRKTDAQQACKIDVNKASKLWTAFDKVGWLNSKWVEQHV